MAQVADFTIDQGSTWSTTLIWKNEAGVVINLTGYTARMQLRRAFTDGTADVNLTSPTGIVITALEGKLVPTITAAVTDDLTGEYLYDLEVESADGVVTRLVQGKITISPAVTK